MKKKISEKWIYAFSDLFIKGSTYCMLLLFAYFMTEEDYGNLSIYNSLITMFVVFVTFNLTTSYISKSKFKNEEKFSKIISSVISFLSITNVIYIFIGLILFVTFDSIFSIKNTILLSGLLTGILYANFNLILTIFTLEKKKKEYLLISVIYSILLFIFSFLLLFLNNKLGAYVLIIPKIILLVFINIFVIIYLKKNYDFKFQIDKKIIKDSLKYSLPLMLHSLSAYVLNYFDKFMINDIIGIEEAAYYSFAYNLSSILLVFALATNKSFIPFMYKELKENNSQNIEKRLKQDLSILSIVSLIYIIGIALAYIIFPIEYRSSLLIFILLGSSYMIIYGYNVYSNYLLYYGKTINVFINTFISGATNFILNLFLIRYLSSLGATISTIISYIILFILFYISTKKEDKSSVSIKIFLQKYLIFYIQIAIILILTQLNLRYLLLPYLFILMILFLKKVRSNAYEKSNKEIL